MDVVEADPGGPGRPGLGAGAPAGAPAAAVWDAAELFDVDMDQLARPVPLIAHGGSLTGPDDLAGHRVAVRQAGLPGTAQDPRHRPRRHAGGLGDEPRPAAPPAPGGPPPGFPPVRR